MDEPIDDEFAEYTGADRYHWKPPRKGRPSRRHRYIHAVAQAYADYRLGAASRGWRVSIGKSIFKAVITQYAKNWLAEHSELPQGKHVCVGRVRNVSRPTTIEIDFTALWASQWDQVASPSRAFDPPAPDKA